jgi:hypothetical protein
MWERFQCKMCLPDLHSVSEPHHFFVAPAPGKNFDVALAAPALTLLYGKAKF